MQSECVMPSLKELEQLKLSSSTKSATVDKFITKHRNEAVSNVEFTMTNEYIFLVKKNGTNQLK